MDETKGSSKLNLEEEFGVSDVIMDILKGILPKAIPKAVEKLEQLVGKGDDEKMMVLKRLKNGKLHVMFFDVSGEYSISDKCIDAPVVVQDDGKPMIYEVGSFIDTMAQGTFEESNTSVIALHKDIKQNTP